MQHKNILFITRSNDYRDLMRQFSDKFDASVAFATPISFSQVSTANYQFDLIIIDVKDLNQQIFENIELYIADHACVSRLMLLSQKELATFHMPSQGRCDFIVDKASDAEFNLRVSLLLWPGKESIPADIIAIDNMTINLSTYQVYINGESVDLTLMEYSLLSFLVTHPSCAFSRETLLQRVWGFEYCGGTRTVDVHIRRVRSKLGSLIASHIITVRGIGYLFKL